MARLLCTVEGFLIAPSQKLARTYSPGSKNRLSVKVCEVEADPSQTILTMKFLLLLRCNSFNSH